MPAKPKAKTKAKPKRKARKSNAGRKTLMTAATVNKLEEAYLMGCSDLEACLFADISRQTLYNYQKKNPEFVERKERLKTNPIMRAKKVQLKDLDGEDSQIAQKVLDRHEGKKVAVTGADGGPVEVASITVEMTPEEAGRIYADFFKSD